MRVRLVLSLLSPLSSKLLSILSQESIISLILGLPFFLLISTIFNDIVSKGEHNHLWNAEGFNSGIYFAKISSNDNYIVKKISLIK